MQIDFIADINSSLKEELGYSSTDRYIVGVLWGHFIFIVFLALAAAVFQVAKYYPSPFAWRVLGPVEAAVAVGIGLLATIVPVLVRKKIKNHYVWRVLVTVVLTVFSYLLVFMSGGSIEMHFHFFIIAALLVIFADWRLGWILLLFTGLHHGILNYVQPGWVYFYGRNDFSVIAHSIPVLVAVLFTTKLSETHRASVMELKSASASMRAAKESAVEERSRLLASINSISFGFAVMGKDHTLLVRNNAIAETFGLNGKGRKAKNIDDIAALEKGIDIRKMAEECMRTGRPRELEEVTFGTRIVRGLISPVPSVQNPRQSMGYVVMLEDITERKVLDRGKDEFLSIASHELRTPLTAIRGNALILEDFYSEKLPDVEVKNMIADIRTGSERLIGIVNQFLDLSRLEQKRFNFKKENVDLVKTIEEVVEECGGLAQEAGITLTVIQPAKAPAAALADKDRVKQVLVNLIGNAIKFTPKGGVTVSVVEQKKQLRITVKDTGMGIIPENQSLLFRKFQQAGKDTLARDVSHGTGLGLYISKLIVESMGGTIGLDESIPGQGSTFSFALPLSSDRK